MSSVQDVPGISVTGEVGGVHFSTPSERTIALFYPTQSFSEPQLGAEYVEGSRYHLREGNDRLAALLIEWQKQGKVRVELL